LALRQKLGKLIAVANSKLGDKFLAQVTFILLILFRINLIDTLLNTCIYSFTFIETGGEAFCH
jgi:hypothetical protein